MTYDFDDTDDEGIFGNEEKRAAGDSAALADMLAEGNVPTFRMNVNEHGLVVPDIEDTSILDDPPRVDATNFICLGGPCKYYTENLRFEAEGPAPDAEDHLVTGRWCGRLRTWAEPTSLNELEVFGCTSFSPIVETTPQLVADALKQNVIEIARMRATATKEKLNLGICVVGPCEYFLEMLVRTPDYRYDVTYRQSRRYCTRLAGLGRLYGLREKPVFACTGWKPIGTSSEIAKFVLHNIAAIKKSRQIFASRYQEEDEELKVQSDLEDQEEKEKEKTEKAEETKQPQIGVEDLSLLGEDFENEEEELD